MECQLCHKEKGELYWSAQDPFDRFYCAICFFWAQTQRWWGKSKEELAQRREQSLKALELAKAARIEKKKQQAEVQRGEREVVEVGI